MVDRAAARLDKYVAEQCPQLSRSRVQKLICQGDITVNSREAKPGQRLEAGDRVDITVPAPRPLAAEAIPVEIIYQDEDILVVDKPPGLPVHPAPGHPDHTLVNAVLPHLPRPAGGDLRPGIVHRLDKDASGVLVMAKNAAAGENLISQFRARAVTKAYIVLVRGRLEPSDGVVEAPIGRHPRHRQRMAVAADGEGKEARTGYHAVKYLEDYTLLEVKPETGRTHQIRVHLAAIGHPVAGDTVYGAKSPEIPRMFLHACRLGFKLPSTGEYKEFASKLPADLERALGAIG